MISSKIGVLEQSQPALLCFASHTTVLPVFTYVTNVRDQTRQTFATSFCPFRDRTSKFFTDHRRSGRPICCRNTSRLWSSRGAALLAATHFGRVVGPPTASRRNGPVVPWVSLPGPTGVITHPG